MAAAASSSGYIRENWNPSKNHSDLERWICIYPAYINSKKTRQEGRRLPKENCVENPTYTEIRDVMISSGGLQVGGEKDKQYSREKSRELQCRGRIRVQMRNDDGTFCSPELKSREDIMRFVASRIPQLKTRQNNPSGIIEQQAPQTHQAPPKSKGKRR